MSSSRVFVNHNPYSPPPHPGPSHTRFICLSDTHSRSFAVPPGDVLLHAGDLTSWGKNSELTKTLDWLKSLPHPVKIIIAGNHDLCLDEAWAKMFDTKAAQASVRDASARDAGILYLEHEAVVFTTARGRTWKVYGSPAAPLYSQPGSFQYSSYKEAQDIYARIPVDTDILLTHTPPYNFHDLTKRGRHAGCKSLAVRIRELETTSVVSSAHDIDKTVGAKEALFAWNCKLHVWGHIHEAYGASLESEQTRQTVQVNAAIAHERAPIIVDLYN